MGSDHNLELASSSPIDVRAWLKANHPPKLLSALDKFEIELRLGRVISASTIRVTGDPALDAGNLYDGTLNRRLVTSRTVQLFKVLVGSTKWRTAAQLMTLLKGLGRELHAAGGFREPAIANVVRRIMSCVREEVASQDAVASAALEKEQVEDRQIQAVINRMTATTLTTSSIRLEQKQITQATNTGANVPRNLSLASMLWAHPQHVTVSSKQRTALSRNIKLRGDSFSSDSGDHRAATTLAVESLPDAFHVVRAELRQSVMEAIQEIANELEDLHKNINDQATSHIHADEVILTYSRSQTVELVRFFIPLLLALLW
jgi:translation initiation factor eIF-2B subunit beta